MTDVYPASLGSKKPDTFARLIAFAEEYGVYGFAEASHPESIRENNVLRASYAATAVVAYGLRTREGHSTDSETLLTDLLGDFLHLCDLLGLSFDDLEAQARSHYEPELRGTL